jgi:hypothetical protein
MIPAHEAARGGPKPAIRIEAAPTKTCSSADQMLSSV